MIERQIERPMPMPLDLVVKKVLKRRSALSEENSTPKSVSVTRTCCASYFSGSDHELTQSVLDRLQLFREIEQAFAELVRLQAPE